MTAPLTSKGRDASHILSMTTSSQSIQLCLHTSTTTTPSGKKKGKKKGLTLTPEQIQLLVRVTGILKFLSLVRLCVDF